MPINWEKLTLSPEEIDRIWKGIDTTSEFGCWISNRNKNNNGYPMIKIRRISSVNQLLTRLIWVTINGHIPDGLHVLHTCDNPSCCRPNHLFLGTHQDNMKDRDIKGRNKIVHHKGEKNGNTRLKDEDIRQIRFLRESGLSYQKIADRFPVTKRTVINIIQRKSWSHVD